MAWTFQSGTESHDFNFSISVGSGASAGAGFNSGTFNIGDLLLMGIDAGFNNVNFSLTDDQSNTWNQVDTQMLDRGDTYHIGVWWALATTTSRPTVTYQNIGSSGATFVSWQLVSFTPPAIGVTLDTFNPANGTGTAVISSVVTNGADELIVGWPLSTVGSATGSHTGSTTTLSFGGNNNPFQYRNEAIAGTYAVGSDFAASNPFGCFGVSFAPGGAAPSNRNRIRAILL